AGPQPCGPPATAAKVRELGPQPAGGDTPLRLLTSREAATVGGRFTSRWTCPGLPVEHRQFGPGVCAHVRRDRSMRSRWAARLTAIKKSPQRAWLNEVSAVVLQQALADLNIAYRNFFASRAGRRTGPKAGKPRFRSRKDHRQAIRFTANARFKVLPNGKLRLP